MREIAVLAALSPSAAPPTRNHDLYLDWLRGIAALMVFLCHVRGGYFVKWGDLDPASQGYVNFVLFFATRLGREAVIVFFVLSGFLVGGQALADRRSGRFSFRHYMIARAARMYTVLVPALALTALFDLGNGIWSQTGGGWQTLLVNLFFLQGIFGNTYGSNAPLWSLAFEWWFYVLFGACIAVTVRPLRWQAILAAAIACAIVALLWLRQDAILLMFPLWLMGVLARTVPPITSRRVAVFVAALAVFCASLVFSALRLDVIGDWVVAAASAILIYCMRDLPALPYGWFHAGKFLAAFSFSLYAVHYPLNILAQRLFVKQRLADAGPAHWLGWLALATGMAAICYGVYFLSERRTPAVRAWLLRLLRPRDSAAGPAAKPPHKESPPCAG